MKRIYKLFLFGFLFMFLFCLFSCNNSNGKTMYTVKFDTGCDIVIESQKIEKGNKISEPVIERDGYYFYGWYYKGELWSFIGYVVTENMTLEALWEAKSYKLSIKLNDSSAGTVHGGGWYDVDEEVTITAESNPWYEFIGWYNDEECVSSEESYTFIMPAHEVLYVAKWIIPGSYHLSINSGDAEAGTVHGYGWYHEGEEVTITAESNPWYEFIGWYNDKELVSSEPSYSFIMPAHEILYVAKWIALEIPEYLNVKFDLKGNAAIAATADKSSEVVKYKGRVIEDPIITTPALDSKNHEMTFIGWYTSVTDAASGDTTKAVIPSGEQIIQDTTFYAGWAIIKIDSEEAFRKYINVESQTVNAYIANDITFTTAGVGNGGTMSAILYGDNHTITGLSVFGAIWDKFSGTIQDINFKSVTATTTDRCAAVLASIVEDGAAFIDISFDGVEFTNTASDGYAAVVAAQVKDAQVNATFDGITIKGLDMECVKYSAGILATIRSSLVTVNFTDCLVQGDIVATGETIGFIFGYTDYSDVVLTFDGVVVSGTITAGKNVGAIVGNIKREGTTVIVKNSAVIGYTGVVTFDQASANQINTFVGQNYGTLTLDTATCFYQDNGSTLIRNGSVSTSTVKQGTEISLETLSTKVLSSNILFNYDENTFELTVHCNHISIKVS